LREGKPAMAKLMKKRSRKAGLPPGSLVHIGETITGEVKIAVIDYQGTHFEEKQIKTVEECFPLKETATVTWINIEGLHQVEVIKQLGDHFGLHPLVQEDILNTDQRPKMEDYDDYLYLVAKMLSHDEKKNGLVIEQISIILGPNFVLSFQEGIEGDVFNATRDRIRNSKGRIRNLGADFLAYTLLDSIVDNYFLILERMGETIEFLEEELVESPTRRTLHAIHALKRQMIFLRKSVWPLREVVNSLERGDSPLVSDTTRPYFRDVYDHTIHVIDTIETFRDMISGMLDIYLSSVSHRLNEVMKVLTIIATLFMPITFIASIYGMNFEFMPEIHWRWGYTVTLGIMAVVAIAMLIYFRKKKWL
jgi:magnesium transporter